MTLSKKDLLELQTFLIDDGYKSNKTIDDLKQTIKELPQRITTYRAKLLHYPNVVVLYLCKKGKVIMEVIYEK